MDAGLQEVYCYLILLIIRITRLVFNYLRVSKEGFANIDLYYYFIINYYS